MFRNKFLRNKILIFIFTIPIYFIILASCGLILGLYYSFKFEIDVLYIKQIIKSKDILILVKKFIKIGIEFFYSYPKEEYICKVSIFQFFSGKFLDLFILGYIFSEILENKNN